MSEQGRKPALHLESTEPAAALPPAWREFMIFCKDLQHGEIERLCIQDGVPVLAETARKKIRFARDRGS